MKSARFSITFALFLAIIFTYSPKTFGQDTVINGGWYFDSIEGELVKNSTIFVRSGKFFVVNGDISKFDIDNPTTINLSDNEYILPGIFDLHAHYKVNLVGKGMRDEVWVNPIIFIANGVTSTFPAGEFDPEDMLELRKSIDSGEKVGPRLYNSGPYFGPGGRTWNKNATDQDIYDQVDKWAALGAKGFKAKRISPKHLKPLLERAHYHGLTVTGHLDSGYRDTINPKQAILMGIDRIEHFLGGDALDATKSAYTTLVDFKPGTPEFNDIIQLFIDQQVYFDATITAYGYFGDRKYGFDYWAPETDFFTDYVKNYINSQKPRRVNKQFQTIFEIKQKTLKAFFDAGGSKLITLGTDHGSTGEYISGFSAHRELEAFVYSGIPAAAALQIATINGARALSMSDKLGSIEPGKLADLFIVTGNPLDDIKNTRKIKTVMKGGRLFDPAKLLESVKGKMGPKNDKEVVEWYKKK